MNEWEKKLIIQAYGCHNATDECPNDCSECGKCAFWEPGGGYSGIEVEYGKEKRDA